MLATLSLPWRRAPALVLGVAAPVSLALGLPFPLGLSRLGGGGDAALGLGAERRLLGGGDAAGQPDRARGRATTGFCCAPPLLYVMALVTFPPARKTFRGRIWRCTLTPRTDRRRRGAGRPRAPGRRGRRAPRPGRTRPTTTAMRASGRPVHQTAGAVRRHPGAQAGGDEAHRGLSEGSTWAHADPAVMAAFEAVPRDYFHYLYSEHLATPGDAYEEVPKPWGLGYGSALSDYLGQAYMTQICQPKPGDVTLEIGTGSGLPERAAVAHRRAGLHDRDHRAAGRGGGEDFCARSATTTCTRGWATAITAGPRWRAGSTSSS